VITGLVNPRAAGERECSNASAPMIKRVAVVGAGVVVMTTALEAGRRGHHLTLPEAALPGSVDSSRWQQTFLATQQSTLS
jgi:2,4-dienoyl-CoA reductase (NADPH2)